MALIAGISGLFAVLVGWLVTARLFALARRSRQEPERLLALAFGGLFCVGYPLAGASRAPGLVGTNEGALLFAFGALGMVVGIVALGRFPRVVFRPAAGWAHALSLAITLLGAGGGLGAVVAVAGAETRTDMIARMQVPAIALVSAVLLSYLWNALESIRYWRIMKRRVAIGLAQPETTHRFLLWGLSAILSVAMAGMILGIRASGAPIMSPVPMAIIAASACFTSCCWYLAFFMPDAYRRRVVRVHDATEPSTD